MAARAQITDRALRYRANRLIPNHAKVCAFCGQPQSVEVGHVNGDESDFAPDNLTWTCRSCNVIAGNTLRSEGIGRLTNQYNPSKSGGASNIGEWTLAVGAIHPRIQKGPRAGQFEKHPRNEGITSEMSVSDAVAMIRATPHSKRSQFASQLRKHMRSRAESRWNPAKKNLWPFDGGLKHGTTPATGGIAHHMPPGSKKGVRLSSTLYRGYKIARTEDGEWFSTLDPDSWYDTSAQVKRSIDSYLKGRSNPAKFERCVKEVQAKGGAVNAYAVCSAAGTRKNAGITVIPLGLYDVQQLDQTGKAIYRKLRSKGNPKNPVESATRLYESFHGRPSEKITEVDEEIHFHSALAELGILKELRVKARDGSIVYLKNFDGPDGHCLLCSNEDGTQLYFMGGDQAVDLEEFDLAKPYHDFEDLGEVKQIRYFTTKDHLGSQGGEAVYYHDFGEEDVERGEKARRPRLVYSTRDSRLKLTGGAYEVKPEGIAN